MTAPTQDEILAFNPDELGALLRDCMTELQQGTMTPSQVNAIARAVNMRLALLQAALRSREGQRISGS